MNYYYNGIRVRLLYNLSQINTNLTNGVRNCRAEDYLYGYALAV